jgi:short-subunit dehydrogenase
MSTQTALITGASGGIGYELAKLFAKNKYNLVLVARSGPKLAQFAAELERQFGITVKTYALDLSHPEAPNQLFAELQRGGIAIDVLVNNAGYGRFGEFADVALEESLGQIQLNVTALTQMTKLFLGPMLERRSGKIMNVASTAAFQAGPLMAVYYASKAYVLSFSEGIANELRGTGVTVTCFCPGATDTNFQHRAGTENSRLFKQLSPADVKAVARDGYRAVMKGQTVAISGWRNWLVAESTRFAPRKVVTSISRWVAEKV